MIYLIYTKKVAYTPKHISDFYFWFNSELLGFLFNSIYNNSSIFGARKQSSVSDALGDLIPPRRGIEPKGKWQALAMQDSSRLAFPETGSSMCLMSQDDELRKREAGETWSRLTFYRPNDNEDQNTTEMHVIWTYIYLKTPF